MIHIAGQQVQVGSRLRQRCGWCGTVLLDYDLANIAVPKGQDPTPGMWEVGQLVYDEGGVSYIVPHEEGDNLPDGSCALLDDEVTV